MGKRKRKFISTDARDVKSNGKKWFIAIQVENEKCVPLNFVVSQFVVNVYIRLFMVYVCVCVCLDFSCSLLRCTDFYPFHISFKRSLCKCYFLQFTRHCCFVLCADIFHFGSHWLAKSGCTLHLIRQGKGWIQSANENRHKTYLCQPPLYLNGMITTATTVKSAKGEQNCEWT